MYTFYAMEEKPPVAPEWRGAETASLVCVSSLQTEVEVRIMLPDAVYAQHDPMKFLNKGFNLSTHSTQAKDPQVTVKVN